MSTKTCTGCGLELPVASYAKKSNVRSGLSAMCRGCVSVRFKARYLADTEFRERAKTRAVEQRLADPEAVKAYKKAYHQNNQEAILAKHKAYYAENKEVMLAKNAEYVKQNRHVANAANSRWQANNPDKKRAIKMRRRGKDGDYINAKIIHALWHKQNGLCIYCRAKLGDSPKSKQTYHIDHIHPISKGGTNELHNLQCLCPPCNLKKGAKLPHDFAQELGRLF
jgi:5-methylcytosine-specific restriction endonuclease McrA